MKRKNMRLFIYLLSLSCFMCLSCADDESYDFLGDSVNRIYLKSLDNTVNGFDKASLNLMKTPVDIIYNVLKFPVFSTFSANGDISVVFSIDNSLVKSYNIKNGVSYKEFPLKMINLQNRELKIASNSTVSESLVEVRIQTDAAATLEKGTYLVPITIASVTGNAEISSNRNTIYIIVTVSEDMDNIWDSNPLSKGNLLDIDRTNWTLTTSNSNFVGETNGLFDGDINSYVQYSISSYDDNTGFIMDLKQEYSNISGVYQYYYTGSYAVKESDIYTSLDGENWTYQGLYKSLGSSVSDICFYSPVKARYIKTVVRSIFGYVYIRELNIYVK